MVAIIDSSVPHGVAQCVVTKESNVAPNTRTRPNAGIGNNQVKGLFFTDTAVIKFKNASEIKSVF